LAQLTWLGRPHSERSQRNLSGRFTEALVFSDEATLTPKLDHRTRTVIVGL